jgi:hypothetical protein
LSDEDTKKFINSLLVGVEVREVPQFILDAFRVKDCIILVNR